MTIAAISAIFERIRQGYLQLGEQLLGENPDLEAVARALASIDAELATVPPPSLIADLDPNGAADLAASARVCDTQRQTLLTQLSQLRQRLTESAADEQRAARAARAYRSAEDASDGRFIDQRS